MRRAAASFALALLVGCAAPGDPTARHPVVPTAVFDLAARQAGSDVVLSFTLPTRSTDREALAESPGIDIYRAALPPGTPPSRKTSWRLIYAVPSERVDSYVQGDSVEFRDPLSPNDLAGAVGFPLTYMVRTREVTTRASDDSNAVTIPIYPPPETPRDVRTTVTESAIVVSWAESAAPPGASLAGYRVYRGEIESGQEPVPQNLSPAKLKSPLELLGSPPSPNFQDTNFEFDNTYLYTVRSVAQFGAEAVESADSAPVSVTPQDIFPPAAPKALEIAIIPATPQAPAYVELSWAISSEADLAGYNVYRSDREDTPGTRRNAETLPSPTFRDISIEPGVRYFYRVSAVDRTGNESPKSSAVQIVVP